MRPAPTGLAAALRIVREQVVFNRRREAAHFGEHPKRKPSLQPLLRSHLPIRSFLAQALKESSTYMSMKLYVGNLSFQTSSEDLQQLFAQAGTVESASVVEDRDTGRSRGFGFVEMSTKEEAKLLLPSSMARKSTAVR